MHRRLTVPMPLRRVRDTLSEGPERSVTSPLCLVGGTSDGANGLPPLTQTITSSSFQVTRSGWHEAHPLARTREHSEATTDPHGSLQPEPHPTQADGSGHAAGVEKPRRLACFSCFFALLGLGRPQSVIQKQNSTTLHETTQRTTTWKTSLALPEITCLHHSLLDKG